MTDDARDELDDSLPTLDVGDHVQDREDPDPTLVVVATPLERAASYNIDEDGTTVADVNPDYPAADHIVEVVYPEATSTDIDRLHRYAYPRERLERTVAVHSGENGDA